MAGSVNSRTTRAAHVTVFVLALVLFFTPMLSAALFGFTLPGTTGLTTESLAMVFDHPRAVESIVRTLLLALLSTIAALVLLVPTLIYLHLKATPGVRRVAETLSVLPLVVPAVALVSGAGIFFRAVFPSFLVEWWSLVPFYVILALPLVYRALDAGVRALDLETLWAASSALGASSLQTLIHVILPNMRVAILAAALLCVSMVVGEFALASLLLHYTFPVFTVEVGGTQPRGAAALAFLTIVVTWGLLIVITALGNRARRRSPAS